MSAISNVNAGQFRPASVSLSAVGQTEQKKVTQAEQAKVNRAEEAALQEVPAQRAPEVDQYTPGVKAVSAGEYRVGQDENGNRKIIVDPVTEPGTPVVGEEAVRESVESGGMAIGGIRAEHMTQAAEAALEREFSTDIMADTFSSPYDAGLTQMPTTSGFSLGDTQLVRDDGLSVESAQEGAATAFTAKVEMTDIEKGLTVEGMRDRQRNSPTVRSLEAARNDPPPVRRARTVSESGFSVREAQTDDDRFPVENAEAEEDSGGAVGKAPEAIESAFSLEDAKTVIQNAFYARREAMTSGAGAAGNAEAVQNDNAVTLPGQGQRPETAVTLPGQGQRDETAVTLPGQGQQGEDAENAVTLPGQGKQGEDAANAVRLPGQGKQGEDAANAVRLPGQGKQGEDAANAVRLPGQGKQGEDAANAVKLPGQGKKTENAAKLPGQDDKKTDAAQKKEQANKEEQAKKSEQAERTKKAEAAKKRKQATTDKLKKDIQRLKGIISREKDPERAQKLSQRLMQMKVKLHQSSENAPVSLLFK